MASNGFYYDKKILITGGLGFIGSTLAIRLIESGAQVTLLDGLLPDLGANLFNIEPIINQVTVVKANLGDRSMVDDQVKGKDLFFNIGMHSCHLASMTNPLFDLETNIIPQFHFLEALRSHNPQARVVYIGTRAQFGQALTVPIPGDTPPN
ncbi:MAG: GDP-mannose 4,6-dehydratase, partial [Syntrophales bacterium LBB04]|nr:GDP-mannose 4,6-dehydratase [Syntrophales bacterium LBB04]